MMSPPFSVRVGRITFQLPLVLWLTLVWVLMWDRVSVANALSGLAVALVLTTVFPFPPLDPGLRLHPVGFLRFCVRFGWDLLRSAGPLTWAAIDSSHRRTANSVIAVRLRTHSDALLTATAIALSATPGMLVVDVRRGTGTLFLHVLGVGDERAVERVRRLVLAQEARVIRAFGTRADLRSLGEPDPEEGT